MEKMMSKTSLFGLCCLLFSCSGVSAVDPNRVITKNLVIDNGLEFGQWGEIEYCMDDSYVHDIEVMFEPYSLLHVDETAINTVKLFCKKIDGQVTGYIISQMGEKGEWQGERACPNGYMTGLRAQVLPYEGTTSDDVAVQNIEMMCNYGESSVLAVDEASDEKKIGVEPGVWSEWSMCDSDSAICGLKVRYEKSFIVEDTVAVSDIEMYCCSVFPPPSGQDDQAN